MYIELFFETRFLTPLKPLECIISTKIGFTVTGLRSNSIVTEMILI